MEKQNQMISKDTYWTRHCRLSLPICLGLILLLLVANRASAQVSLHTDCLRVGIDQTGSLVSIHDLVNNKEYLAQNQPAYLLKVRLGNNKIEHPTEVVFSPDNHLMKFVYGQSSIRAEVKIVQEKTHLTFELVSIVPEEKVSRIIWGPFPTTIKETVGSTIGVVRNSDYAIGIQGLNVKTLGTASEQDYGSALELHSNNHNLTKRGNVWGHENVKIIPKKGYTIAGSKMAMFGCPADKALETIGIIELAEGLPHPMLDGQWTKTSPTATAAYMIMNFAEANIELALEATKKAGLRYLYHGAPFSSWGHFKLKSDLFPDGVESMIRCANKAEKAGIRLGAHTLSNFITPNDPYVTPIPDHRLALTGTSTIVSAIDETITDIEVATAEPFNNTDRNWMHTVVVGDELIRYGSVSKESPWKLLNCKRGAFHTKASAHQASLKIDKLMDHPYKVFHSNLDLQHEIALNLADLYNKTNLKQISFDGLEGCYSSGHGDYARMLLVKEWYDNLNATDIISDASNSGHFSWHIHTRMNWGEPWYGGFRESQQDYRLKNQKYFQQNLMPPMLGWFHMKETTSLSDIEWLLARAAGFDAGFALCTSLPVLAKNGASDDILAAIKNWETARHSKAFSLQQRKNMQDPANEFHLESVGERAWKLRPIYVTPALKHTGQTLQPGQPTSVEWEFKNPHNKQPLRFMLTVVANDAPTDATVNNPVFELDFSHRLTFDVSLKKDQTLLCDGTEQASVYDKNWILLKTIPIATTIPQVTEGDHTVEFDAEFSSSPSMQVLVNFKTVGSVETIQAQTNPPIIQ